MKHISQIIKKYKQDNKKAYRIENESNNELDKQSVTVASITSENVLTMSGAIAVSALDVLVVVANSSIEGDQIRDYFAKINLTKTSSNAIELYAINMSFADSKLHY